MPRYLPEPVTTATLPSKLQLGIADIVMWLLMLGEVVGDVEKRKAEVVVESELKLMMIYSGGEEPDIYTSIIRDSGGSLWWCVLTSATRRPVQNPSTVSVRPWCRARTLRVLGLKLRVSEPHSSPQPWPRRNVYVCCTAMR
jgi:hypothetical protein